jgi:predicted O-linked N-acetylglucosamine transferase (SPINDLY family)
VDARPGLKRRALRQLVAREQVSRLGRGGKGNPYRYGEMAELRTWMLASPLMDEPRFARDVEAAYRHMWRSWCERPSP